MAQQVTSIRGDGLLRTQGLMVSKTGVTLAAGGLDIKVGGLKVENDPSTMSSKSQP